MPIISTKLNRNAHGTVIFNEEQLGRIKTYMEGGYTDPTKPEYYGTIAGTNGRWQNYGGSFANTNWFDEFYEKWVPSQNITLASVAVMKKLPIC